MLAYPVQAEAADESYCWNWFDQANQQRGQGEPSIIADLTTSLIDEFVGGCEVARFRTLIGPGQIGGGLLMQSDHGLDVQRA
ncbi:hypothetical protein [Nocardia sp. NBC_01009]|uniref:hypothetical protein n=1 Tax=Nocardia sp. NBC_01009 TaxID=2975996 RepID=UPI00386A6E36|nr:PHB depolymerase family esterase [Nocardia sp. NBC_01009]